MLFMNNDTTFLRQIHPAFIHDGRLGSSAFRPSKKDNGLLSVYDGDLIVAEDAFQHFNAQPDCSSRCVCGVTHHETRSIGLESRPDTENHFPQHAVIDFTPYGSSRQEKLAKHLRNFAQDRGILYP